MLKSKEFSIPENTPPNRADKLLFAYLPEKYSRSSVARLVRTGAILVNGHSIRPSTILKPGDRVQIVDREPNPDARPQENVILEHRIIFEDKHVIVVDKPAGLVVHQGAGRPSGTLVDALIRLRPEMLGVGEAGRWGVVHRLDRDTSGCLLFAQKTEAEAQIRPLFVQHRIRKMYHAIVSGFVPGPEQEITHPIEHRDARTLVRTLDANKWASHLWIELETGRTHQIRRHLVAIGHPLLGDQQYATRREVSPQERTVQRQMLHAYELAFRHPVTGKPVHAKAPLADDFAVCLRKFGLT